MVPNDRKYQTSHEWALTQDGLVVVGITDVAVEQLSDLVFVDLPKKGAKFKQGQSFGEIESVKAVSELIAPCDGEVVEVHEALSDDLDILKKDAFTAGWMIKLKPSDVSQLEGLLDGPSYDKHAASEAH
ncbi:MAG TPA: glycine cleavage system protein GcvH [Planctomycetota bacterium]|nr:glycine cleavage system protein GcvH [Planctomycetota bacterium]